MRYSNELKVGATIVVAALIFIFGVRFFQDLPLFRGTYPLQTELANAAGLIPGNPVRVNGVSVGSVNEVSLNPETNRIRVLFHVDSTLPIPEGSRAMVSGFDALGVVRMDIVLGPPGGARIPENGVLASLPTSDIMETVSGKAPELLDQMQSVMANLNQVLGESGGMLADPQSDLRLTLLSARRSVDGIDNLLRTQRERIASVLANIDQASAGLGGFMESNKDSLAMAIASMNATMAQLDRTLAGVDVTSANLNLLLQKINDGEGTLGMLVNDDAMYTKTDSLLTSIQALVNDFQENPGKYLKEMRLVDLF